MPFSSKNLEFPTVIDPADPPIRPKRRVTNSIMSVRVAIARAIARSLHAALAASTSHAE